MAIDIDKFVHDQLSLWPAVAAKYRALKSAQTRQMPIGGLLSTLQSNPGRMPVIDHGCPLCEENYLEHQHFLPFEGRKGRRYRVLVNRAPIFPNHLVITRDIHVPQTIWHRYPDMLDLARTLENYVVFYNSTNSGTSVPGHAHFQACPKGYMPLERAAERIFRSLKAGTAPDDAEYLASVMDASLYHYRKFARGIFLLRAQTSKSMAKMFYRLLDCAPVPEGESEPRFNALTYYSEGEYRAVVMCRDKHRPHHFFAEGEENFAISPGAADMAGFVVVPQEKDFERLDARVLSEIFSEVSISEEVERRLIWRLVRTQPRVEVGIMAADRITFEIISDGAGPQMVSYREGKIDYNGALYDELVFEAVTISTLFAEPSFILHDVTIGVDFHWQRKMAQRFAGTLKFIVVGRKVQAVNIIGVEDYLLSVISSEMNPAAPREFLMAHAVISRSWLMAQIERRRAKEKADVPYKFDALPKLVTWLDSSSKAGETIGDMDREFPELVRWWDHSDHHDFDVCADDHCQRYQGLSRAIGQAAMEAVDETWGKVLRYDGRIADARFSKCCGGMTERYSAAWENTDYPYLPVRHDPYCARADAPVLSTVLNDYDLETRDFLEWKVTYSADELSSVVRDRTGIDFGLVRDLIPLERGGSGRITRLRIAGDRKTVDIGKELMIRKALSRSHLYSSWFDVEKRPDGSFCLRGRGWGHGVGLCQIGAAVMASEGKAYKEILGFYYPGASVE